MQADLCLINTHLPMHSISHGACAFVLLLTCAYELEGSQDCGRMQLRSDVIDPIGAKQTPLLDTWIHGLCLEAESQLSSLSS